MPKKNTRMVRVNDEIVREVANIIRFEMADPRVGAVVSVLRAETTNDFKFCKIFISVPGDQNQQDQAMDALRSATGFIRKRIAETVNLRNTPEITFVYDDSIAHAMRMNRLIDEAVRSAPPWDD